MKVILYMAITANGYIATEDGDSSFTSEADEENFREMVKQVGVVVMGRNTYDYLVKGKAFPIPDALNVVMTTNPPEVESLKDVIFLDGSPEEVVEELKKRELQEVVIAGGGELSGSFMTDGLIDEIYLTVEPVVFGQGINLFEHGEFKRNLELLDTKKISDNEIQLHYGVLRHTLDSYLGS